jgi:hypothetical protein
MTLIFKSKQDEYIRGSFTTTDRRISVLSVASQSRQFQIVVERQRTMAEEALQRKYLTSKIKHRCPTTRYGGG